MSECVCVCSLRNNLSHFSLLALEPDKKLQGCSGWIYGLCHPAPRNFIQEASDSQIWCPSTESKEEEREGQLCSLSLRDAREVEAHLRECPLPVPSLRARRLAQATHTLQTGPVEWEEDRQGE